MVKMCFTNKDVVHINNYLIQKAESAFKRKKYSKSLKYLKSSARWSYYLNFIYCNSYAENLLKNIGDVVIQKKYVKSENGERYVLIDTCSVDDRGLHQQYIRTFIKLGVEFLFITQRHDITSLVKTINEINQCEKGTYYCYNEKNIDSISKAKLISKEIKKFAPNRIFLHIMPFDLCSLLAVNSIEGPLKYNINLTDHAFWMGASFVDYNIEFRHYGYTVSLEKRFLKEESLIPLPFYPVVQKYNELKWLPPKASSKTVVIFAGGSPYKMLGKNDFFFTNIVDRLLSLSSEIVIWIAGFQIDDSLFGKKISTLRNKDRIFNIGVRDDINEVYKKIDIFLGTYPKSGGLMTQLAAINGKPILSFRDKDFGEGDRIEELVNHFTIAMHSYTDFNDFMDYAKKLLEDKDFRLAEGRKVSEAIMTEQKFVELFKGIIIEGKKKFQWHKVDINYESIAKSYLELENEQIHGGVTELIADYKLWAFPMFWRYFPIILCNFTRLAKKYSFNLKKLL